MSTLIMKFGGASLSTPKHFAQVAKIVAHRQQKFKNIIVVVSAMANMTDQLIDLATSVHPSPPQREMDMLITIGERVSISLLSMSLHALGIKAISYTGSQSGILTTSEHADARIIDVKPWRLKKSLDEGFVVIVAGFQGVSAEKEITTLGRGGSDTSAVALGVAFEASHVEFYKDVGGLYEDDPKKTLSSKLIKSISLSEAVSRAQFKTSVLHLRCLQLALKNNLKLRVLPFDGNKKNGTELFATSDVANSIAEYEV